MAIKPMPTPSADPYSAYNTEKNKKKKQTNSGYVTNTVTPPPQPAPEVPSVPPIVSNYTQPVPKPDTSSHTNGYLTNAGSYNPLSLKQNSQSSQKSAMDTIYNKTVTYDAVPIPKTQHGSVKPQQPKSYSYTEPKPKTNQYVNNGVNTYTAPKQQMHTPPKTYTYTPPKPHPSTPPKLYPLDPPKTNIGEYKTLGGYTNANPYVSKDRVDNGQNDYAGAKKQNAVDELWKRYYAEITGKNETVQPQKRMKTSESSKQKIQTVKAGKSTINIRDDGSTIHYNSDTAIDLFDFLDFLSGRYGPSNEMAESVKIDDKAQNRAVGIELTSTNSDTAKEEFYRDRLSKVNWQIVDMATKDEPLTDKDMDKLTALYEEKDYLHKQLKLDLYDEDLSLVDRLNLAAQGEAYSRVYGPETIVELSNQALDELFDNKNSDVLKQLLNTQKYIERRISGLSYLERNGFITVSEKDELMELQSEKERIENDIKKYKYSFDTGSRSVQGSLKGLQYKQKAIEGLSPVQAQLFNTGTDMLYNIPYYLLAKGNPLIYTLIDGVNETAEKTTEMIAAGNSPLQISMNIALNEAAKMAVEKIPADKLIDAVKSETGKYIIYDFLESNDYVVTKEAIEYVTNYIVDVATNNTDSEFSIAELLAEITKAYIEEDIIED